MFIALIILCILLSAIYLFCTTNYGYWKKKNVPHLKPTPLMGNYGKFFLRKMTMPELEQQICEEFKDEPFVGAYFGTLPCLIVQDPQFVKLVTTKDFYYFNAREGSTLFHKEVMMTNLFNAYGDIWKVLRQNLTPVFSSAKMKNMFYLIGECSKTFESLLDSEIQKYETLEARNVVGLFTMDCIGSCAFGINTKAMDENSPNNVFVNIARIILSPNINDFMKFNFRIVWPNIFYFLGFKAMSNVVADFFTKLLTDVFVARKYQPTNRNDFVDFILKFNNKKCISGDRIANSKTGEKEKYDLEINDGVLVAQCFIFLAAGFETSATTITYTLYELAKHPDLQKRVQDEIDEYLQNHNNELTYDCLVELPYTEQCVDETLRLYPVLGSINRELVETYTIPNTNITLDKGVTIHLPVRHIQRNPKYFPNPDEFRPERFSPEQKKNIVPYSYFPFGEGPRTCIGMRFAKMQMAAALVTVLKKYHVTLHEDTPTKLEFEPMSIITQPIHPIKLRFTIRTDRDPIMFSK